MSILFKHKVNWRYAIGEVVLIFIGITLAIAFNNWNENMKLRAKEQNLLIELNKEFAENREQFDRVILEHEKLIEVCDQLLKLFPISLKDLDLEKTIKNVVGVAYAYTFNPSQGTINSIINTSTFQIIRNDELRTLLISWNGTLEDYQEEEYWAHKFVVEELDPYLSQHFPYDTIWNDPRINYQELESLRFEWMIKRRKDDLSNILEVDDFALIQNSMKRIIQLTQTE